MHSDDIDDEDGWHPYLQWHAVRWMFPVNECGNKYLIGLNVPHTGRRMYVKTEWDDGFPEEAKKKGYQATMKVGDSLKISKSFNQACSYGAFTDRLSDCGDGKAHNVGGDISASGEYDFDNGFTKSFWAALLT